MGMFCLCFTFCSMKYVFNRVHPEGTSRVRYCPSPIEHMQGKKRGEMWRTSCEQLAIAG